MARKKLTKTEAAPKVEEPPEPPKQPLTSTRNLERPKGSIRIVPGRKDAK